MRSDQKQINQSSMHIQPDPYLNLFLESNITQSESIDNL